MKILLDTSVVIDFTRQSVNKESLLVRLSQIYSDFYVSDVTIAELYSGKYIWEDTSKMKKLEGIIQELVRFPTTKEICVLAGRIRSQKGISLLDAIIAATAIENNLPLATLNVKDFENIPGLKLIKI